MKRYLIHLAYNGKNYHGWQVQENAHTVQAEVNEKISLLLKSEINVVGCGRTDTGVHARDFYAHFDHEVPIPDPDELAYRLDQFLPGDIAIWNVKEVSPDIHARFSAVSRTYAYYISTRKAPFLEGQCYVYTGPLNLGAMSSSCKYLFPYTDFTSFSKLHTQTATNNCTVTRASWEKEGGMLIFTITADRFLRNMVRAIVGSMIEIGKGKLKPDDLGHIIEAKDRSTENIQRPQYTAAHSGA
ncbi:MAG: tRNA pseudouridine(38-40) synthase TruA [bacterium]